MSDQDQMPQWVKDAYEGVREFFESSQTQIPKTFTPEQAIEEMQHKDEQEAKERLEFCKAMVRDGLKFQELQASEGWKTLLALLDKHIEWVKDDAVRRAPGWETVRQARAKVEVLDWMKALVNNLVSAREQAIQELALWHDEKKVKEGL